ncbi:MAG: serine hydrolase domain-containing protein [Saprospiraceae bacterium]
MRLALTLIFITCHFTGFAQLGQNLKEEIQKIIYHDTDISFDRTPGYVIGVIIGDSSYVFGYGSVSKDSVQLPDEHTIFELGSLTKVFTAAIIQRLVEQGKMQYDTSFNQYLPETWSHPSTNQLSLLNLVSHTSGLPKMPLEFGIKEKESHNPYAYYTKADLQDFYHDYFFQAKEKNVYRYGHLNYALLEIAIEQVCQKKFASVLQEELLAPLQLNNTCLQLRPEQQTHLATGYAVTGKATKPWRFQSFAAAQGLKSNAHDLLQFLRVNLNQAAPDFSKSLAQTHQFVAETNMTKNVTVAKGWHILKNRKYYDTIAHSGTTSGHRVFLGFIQETKTGVVVLSNSPHTMNGLGHLIIRLINQNWKKKK